jgi:uncharacterized membrane protein YccC
VSGEGISLLGIAWASHRGEAGLTRTCIGRTLVSKIAAAEAQWEAEKAAAEEAWALTKKQARDEWTAALADIDQRHKDKMDALQHRLEQVWPSAGVAFAP